MIALLLHNLCGPFLFTDLVVFPWLSEDVALTNFFHPLFSVCVYMWTCLCIVRSSFKMHIHTLVHTCILPKLTQPVCRTPNHDYKLKCEELFFSFALFYTFKIFFFLFWFPHDGTPEYFMSCHKLGLHTLPRGALVKRKETYTNTN